MCFGDGVLFGERANEFFLHHRLSPYGAETQRKRVLIARLSDLSEKMVGNETRSQASLP